MSERKLKTAVLGLDDNGQLLLETADKIDYFDILAVADKDPRAVGLLLARDLGIFTTSDDRELCTIEELDLLLELTQTKVSSSVSDPKSHLRFCSWAISMQWRY